jgi:hypothetical protein
MVTAILVAIAIPVVVVGSAWWAHRYHRGKIHLVWGNGSTMGDASLNEEVEDNRIIKLKLNGRGPSGDSGSE